MAVAKTAIINMAKAIPRINNVVLSLAIAVIAITLSRDIETSAIMIVIKAAFNPLPETSLSLLFVSLLVPTIFFEDVLFPILLQINILSGILLTNLNIYPLNIFLHSIGTLDWTFV